MQDIQDTSQRIGQNSRCSLFFKGESDEEEDAVNKEDALDHPVWSLAVVKLRSALFKSTGGLAVPIRSWFELVAVEFQTQCLFLL